MKLRAMLVGLIFAACGSSAFATVATVYSKAKFVPVDGSASRYELLGFGRVTAAPELAPLAAPNSFAARALAPGRVSFFDTWNINVSQMLPGTYSFSTQIDAIDSLEFDFVDLFSYANGVRTNVSFDVSGDGKHATGFGTFTGEKPCPVNICVWLDIRGSQEKGSTTADYASADNFRANAVPEPETYALMLAGLAAIGLIVRRKRQSAG